MGDATNERRKNLCAAALVEESIRRDEGKLSIDGALVVETGDHTGRSANDKFIVKDPLTINTVWWSNNSAMTVENFNLLFDDFKSHMKNKPMFVQQLFACASPAHRIGVEVSTEYAWHSLFIRNLLIRPEADQLEAFSTDFTVIDLPSFKADPKRHGCRSETVIACDFSRRIVLIGGTAYAGEMKKAVFTYLNFILPDRAVLPMHCSANVNSKGDSAIFFGLSGTGKTTLSADPKRNLIGDDEHGWGQDGIFNFEGGCYAKTIKLSPENEPEIYRAAIRSGAVLENVVLDPITRVPDFDNITKTENTRAAYPLPFISNATPSGQAGHPRNLIMLTCDAFGVLPPIARLTPELAVAYFLAGYTAKVAGTERGISEPQATFSPCFGAPFMPRPPQIYGDILRRLIIEHGVTCWLLNTGWTGGPYGIGQRIALKTTRQLLAAVLDGELNHTKFRQDTVFGFEVPLSLHGASSPICTPRANWGSAENYDRSAQRLFALFADNRMEVAKSISA